LTATDPDLTVAAESTQEVTKSPITTNSNYLATSSFSEPDLSDYGMSYTSDVTDSRFIPNLHHNMSDIKNKADEMGDTIHHHHRQRQPTNPVTDTSDAVLFELTQFYSSNSKAAQVTYFNTDPGPAVTAIEWRRQELEAQKRRAQEMRRLGFNQGEIHDCLEFFWYAYLQKYEWPGSPCKLSTLTEVMLNAQAQASTKAIAVRKESVHISSAAEKKRQLQAQEYHERQESDCCLKDDREILAIHLNLLAQNVLEAGNKED
jgi:hypothetical protein